MGELPENEKTSKAIELSGITKDKAEYFESGADDNFNEALSDFFSILNNDLWELYVSGRMAYSHLLEKVREKIDAEGLDEDRVLKAFQLKNDCFTRAEAMQKSLVAIQAKLSPVEATKEAVVKEVRRKSISPESMARSFK